MFKNVRLVILFDFFINPSFKMATSFANIARTTASISNLFGQSIYWKVNLNERADDQIMPWCKRSFINDKCIFQ